MSAKYHVLGLYSFEFFFFFVKHVHSSGDDRFHDSERWLSLMNSSLALSWLDRRHFPSFSSSSSLRWTHLPILHSVHNFCSQVASFAHLNCVPPTKDALTVLWWKSSTREIFSFSQKHVLNKLLNFTAVPNFVCDYSVLRNCYLQLCYAANWRIFLYKFAAMIQVKFSFKNNERVRK